MKISQLITTAAVSTLLMTQVMADVEATESNYEVQNTYQHEYSENNVPGSAEQDRERHQEQNRFQKHLAENGADGDGEKLKAQNRYQDQQRKQSYRSELGQTSSGRFNTVNRSSMSGKGFAGKH